MRHEGDHWNAYWAMPDTMEGAVHLCSIRMAAARVPAIKQAFMDLARQIVSTVFEEQGIEARWPDGPKPAPEHERSGHS